MALLELILLVFTALMSGLISLVVFKEIDDRFHILRKFKCKLGKHIHETKDRKRQYRCLFCNKPTDQFKIVDKRRNYES